MNIQFDIQPRQTGKTTSLINRALLNKNGLFLTMNMRSLLNINRTYNPKKYGIDTKTSSDFINDFMSYEKDFNYKNIYIDEYLFYDEKEQAVLNYIISDCFDDNLNVYIKTTASKLINKNLYNLVRLMKKHNITIMDLPEEIFNSTGYLYFNLLTHPDCKVSINNNYMRTDLSYRTEVLGELFE